MKNNVNVIKVTSKETGEVFYCLRVVDVEQLTCEQRIKFHFGPFKKKWEIEEIDGSELKLKEIYMGKKRVW